MRYKIPGKRVVLIGESKSQIIKTIRDCRKYGSGLAVPDSASISHLEKELMVPPISKVKGIKLLNDAISAEVIPGISFLAEPNSYNDVIDRANSYEKNRIGELFTYPTETWGWLFPRSIMEAMKRYDWEQHKDLVETRIAEQYFCLPAKDRQFHAGWSYCHYD